MRISIIVAVSLNGVIGKDGELPWNQRADLSRFAKLTRNKIVIMGRLTHVSILKRIGQPLQGRTSIIISRKKDFHRSDCHVVSSWEEAVTKAKELSRSNNEEVFVIGGSQIYRVALPHVDTVYMTRIETLCEGDVYFPELSQTEWDCMEVRHYDADSDNNHPYLFVIYRRCGRE